jgi:hypothetical protein
MRFFTIAATFMAFVVSVAGDNVIQVYKNSNWVGMQEELRFTPWTMQYVLHLDSITSSINLPLDP